MLPALMFSLTFAVLLSGFPVAFCLSGTAILFAAGGILTGQFDAAFLAALPERIYGIMINETLIAVPLFVFMGVMLERSRVAESLLESMGRLFGPLRGGLGISVTVVGALLAASTGIVGATVVTMGLLSLPTLLRRGYDPKLATGTICAAGTLGQIIPPSIVLVLLGDVMASAYAKSQMDRGIFAPETVSVGELFAGALLPGLMLVGLYIAYQLAVAIIFPKASPAVPMAVTPRAFSHWPAIRPTPPAAAWNSTVSPAFTSCVRWIRYSTVMPFSIIAAPVSNGIASGSFSRLAAIAVLAP